MYSSVICDKSTGSKGNLQTSGPKNQYSGMRRSGSKQSLQNSGPKPILQSNGAISILRKSGGPKYNFLFEVSDKDLQLVTKTMKELGASFTTDILFDKMIMITVNCNVQQKLFIEEEHGYRLEQESEIVLIS